MFARIYDNSHTAWELRQKTLVHPPLLIRLFPQLGQSLGLLLVVEEVLPDQTYAKCIQKNYYSKQA